MGRTKNLLSKDSFILKGKRLEWFVIGLFVVLYGIITCFHEPWFDEAQAWQIARCASLKELLFVVPHYEGHPALWHLILLIPAKIGLPYEFSLKLIGGIIITACVIILEFKSPFKRWFKLLLPFTFFFFYQYGIIVRPYSLLLLFVMLAAVFFKTKNERPFRFVLCLMLLCFTSAFGILIAAGIAISWVIDILLEKSLKDNLKDLFTTKRMLALWLLLISALCVCWQILPKDDTLATNFSKNNNLFERLICSFFALLPDSFLTENAWSIGENLLIDIEFDYGVLLFASLQGILIWFLVWFFSEKGKFKYFLIMYSIFALFSAVVYFSAHHIGLILYIFMFWAWINFEGNGGYERVEKLKRWIIYKANGQGSGNKLSEMSDIAATVNEVESSSKSNVWNSSTFKVIRSFVTCGEVLIILLSVYWSVSSSVMDIKEQYSFGREAARFIKEYNLDELTVVSEWGYTDTRSEKSDYISDVYYMHIPVNFYPYFEDEFVKNMECGYVTHIYTSEENCEQIIEEWKEIGIPDVLLGYVNLGSLYGDEINRTFYSPVYKLETNIIWRGSDYITYNYIFVRNDLIDEYGLESIYDSISVKE